MLEGGKAVSDDQILKQNKSILKAQIKSTVLFPLLFVGWGFLTGSVNVEDSLLKDLAPWFFGGALVAAASGAFFHLFRVDPDTSRYSGYHVDMIDDEMVFTETDYFSKTAQSGALSCNRILGI